MLMKSVSTLMIASQLGLVSLASAAAPAVSPEFKMLQSVLALQGQNAQSQEKISSVVAHYLSTAPQAGQQIRLEQALVDLGVYNDAQAASFVADSQKAARTAETSADASSTMVSEMTRLANVHPMGAQFSSCELTDSDVSGPIALTGTLVALVGVGFRFDNPTCSAPVIGETYYSNGESATTYGPTTCTQSDYYPHAALGDDLMIAGGVVAAIGGILFAINVSSNCN